MIFTLFSPSEGKRDGGDESPIEEESLLFGPADRKPILDMYNTIVTNDDLDTKLSLFGLKKPEDAAPYIIDIYAAPTMTAVRRYDGVAYDYLDYDTLEVAAQRYLHEQLLIFSNLFGVLRGGDSIPNYKVKQGNAVGDIVPERFYKERFGDRLDEYIAENELLDLRAGYYEKFYKPAQPVTTMKFVKNGKVVSHWAKAYRGIVLRHLAQHRFETVEALLASDIPGLRIKEILEKKNKREVVYDIIG